MPHVKVGGIELYYEVHGKSAKGEPIILLHNGVGCTKSFTRQIDEFSKHFTVIAYDRRGYGRSARVTRLDMNWLNRSVDELSSFLDELGIDKARLCGVCAGGAVALLLAAQNAERISSVAVAGTCCYGEEKALPRVLGLYPPPEQLAAESLQQLAQCHGQTYARELYRIFHQAISEENGYPFRGYDLRPTLSRVRCPILIIYGDRDELFDLEQAFSMYRHLPSAELCVIPCCGHLPNEEKPQEFNRETLSFFHKHQSTTNSPFAPSVQNKAPQVQSTTQG